MDLNTLMKLNRPQWTLKVLHMAHQMKMTSRSTNIPSVDPNWTPRALLRTPNGITSLPLMDPDGHPMNS